VANKGTGIYQRARGSLEDQAVQFGVDFSAVLAEQDAESNYRAGLRFLYRLGAIHGKRKDLYERRVNQISRHAEEDLGVSESDVRALLGLFGSDTSGLGICTQEPACEKCPFKAECKWAKKNPRILDLPLSERPRERLIKDGPESLSDADLIGIIIRDGQPNRTAVDLARMLLSQHGSLRSLANKTIKELCEIPGIGPAKAAQIKAALTIGIRMSVEAGLQRGVFNHAVSHSAAAIVCIHNHPSGDPRPSKEDLEITKRLQEAGRTLGIPLLDHLIVGEQRYFSFADEGLLK
jgi:DNA repair protein RadC